ncbi:acyltransferase family protein [Methanobrevibacter sp.]
MVPYLIFTVLFKLFRYVLTGKFTIDMMFLKPETALWFLLALFFMKISLPIVDRFRYPLLTVTAVAVFSGFLNIDSNLLALARFFGYFPIFLLGFNYESYRDSFAERYPKVYGFYEKYFIVFFALTIIVSLIAISRINTPRICFTSAYEGKIAVEMIKCIIVLVLLFLLIPMISRAMTNRETFLTKFGKNSMAVYMLHVFILIALNHYTRTYIIMNSTVTAIVGVVMSFAVTFILSRDIVTKYLNILTDSVANLILKTENV